MELLCIKLKDCYLKLKDLNYEEVSLQKASVYPVSDYSVVKSAYTALSKKLPNLKIKKLTIIEEDFNEN